MEEVVTYGAEVELSAIVSDNLELNAGIGLLHTEIKDAGEDYPDVDGNELNSASDFTGSLRAKYSFNENLNVGASVNYVGDYYGDFSNTEERVAGGYTQVRFTANYQTGPVLFAAFINNVLDDEGIVSQEPASATSAGYEAIVDPRNMGISATYSF